MVVGELALYVRQICELPFELIPLSARVSYDMLFLVSRIGYH